ncbi:dolichyldiphosphatase 1-like [Bombyx mandarina]|uniref:Dolichyldiphosphatase n=2 Tax=Bombyx TaxID=7090 RepID=A0A8R2C7E8_BOMMO|nr:dolichyldiphosphatase 1 [Bombyx mori]XP_028042461.1 dolichyldiphosphatase 1-like [Bombyx mandarina]
MSKLFENKMDNDQVNDFMHKNGDIEWQPLALTLVEYPRGDLIGKFFAFISLSPFGIGAGFVTLILFRRDLHTIAFFCGTLLNEAVNATLKHIICESRPMTRGNLYNEYGMPSSHAQFIWFFSVYVFYFVLIRLHHINNNSIISALWRVIIVSGCICLAGLVSIGRVYLHYHTTSQVVVGAIVGIMFATIWFALVHRVFTPLFPQIVALKISEMLMIRDTTLIPNVLWFEYTTSRQEARARGRKLAALKPTQ